ncbi:hypothetical protein NOS3756_50690 [Nostoc sp. NIES-3756]|nr:hypothetical protein [Nostoc sp. NIES-3756]BAT56069.1 hypothetical protein NOS3756_50690 [Nostoc sp. NIES-3756]BAY36162.1 hypothetical protein NIES2111_04840 [Nostoc sp. NIES-2111]
MLRIAALGRDERVAGDREVGGVEESRRHIDKLVFILSPSSPSSPYLALY